MTQIEFPEQKRDVSVYTENAINTEEMSFVAYAKVGDLEIGILPVAIGEYHIVGAQIEDDAPVELFRHERETERDALICFARCVLGEYQE